MLPKTLRVSPIVIALALLWPSWVLADDDKKVAYRQALMGAVGANMKAVVTIYKGRLENHKNIRAHGRQMKIVADLTEAAFKEKIQTPKSQSKPEVWSEWPKFVEIINDFRDAAEELADLDDTDDLKEVGQVVKAVGKTCASCHQLYRVKKK